MNIDFKFIYLKKKKKQRLNDFEHSEFRTVTILSRIRCGTLGTSFLTEIIL
jgi:hypothetical protein